jgi:drug/metabolite transporter (DMT)-like permease
LRREVAVALVQTSVSALLWGTSFPVISVALKGGLDPSVFVFLRFAVAAPLMLALAILLRRNVTVLLRSRGVWVLAFLNAVGFLCQFIGQKYTEASVAALLVNLSVVLAAAGGVVFLREKLNSMKVAGVVIAFVGTALIATNGDFTALTGGNLLGDLLYLVAALVWAGYIVYAKKKTEEWKWDPLAVASCIVAVTAVFVLPAALIAHLPFSSISALSWEAIAYTAVFNTAIPFVLYQAGLRQLTASLSAVVLMLEIVVVILITVLFLGETFTVLSALGAVAVLASILLVSGMEVRGKSLSVGERSV